MRLVLYLYMCEMYVYIVGWWSWWVFVWDWGCVLCFLLSMNCFDYTLYRNQLLVFMWLVLYLVVCEMCICIIWWWYAAACWFGIWVVFCWFRIGLCFFMWNWGCDLGPTQEWRRLSWLHRQFRLGTCCHSKGLDLQLPGCCQLLLWGKGDLASGRSVALSWKLPLLLPLRYIASYPFTYHHVVLV